MTFAFVMFANSRHSSLFNDPVWTIGGIAGVAIILIVFFFVWEMIQSERRKEQQRKIDKANNARYLSWKNMVSRIGRIVPVDCSLMLKRDEECLHVAKNVTLFEVRAVRKSTHTFGSMPLGNTHLRIGKGWSTSRSSDEWTAIAIGDLYVTSKQVYFDGDKQDRKIPISKIETIKADFSAVEISSETRQKSMVFMGCNGQIVRDIVQCVAKM